MAILKQRLCRKNADNTYDTLHLETQSSLVKMSDTGETLDEKFAADATDLAGKISTINTSISAKVPATRKINGKTLEADRTLAAGDVGAYSKSEIDSTVNTINSAITQAVDSIETEISEVNDAIGAKNLPITDTKNIIDFYSAENNILNPFIININPNMKMNGFDEPWVGGYGKNKLGLTDETLVSNGLTYTVYHKSSTIHVTGTRTIEAEEIITTSTTVSLSANTYYLSCVGVNASLYIDLYDGSTATVVNNTTDVTLTVEEDTTYTLRIHVSGSLYGDSDSSMILQPMIRLTGDNTFIPYENICPIIKQDSVTIGIARTNLCSGFVKSTGGFIRCTIPVDFEKYTTYEITGMTDTVAWWVKAYDKNGAYVGRSDGQKLTSRKISRNSFVLGNMSDGYRATHNYDNIAYIVIEYYNASTYSAEYINSFNPCVDADKHDTYTDPAQLYNIGFGEAGTIYGGTLDLNRGLLEVRQEGLILTGNESWKTMTSSNPRYVYYYIVVSGSCDTAAFNVNARGCSHFKNANIYTSTNSIGYYAYTTTTLAERNQIRLQFRPDYTKIHSAEEWKNFLREQYEAGTPVTCYWTRLDPTTYSVTNMSINSVFHKNTFYANDNNTLTISHYNQTTYRNIPQIMTRKDVGVPGGAASYDDFAELKAAFLQLQSELTQGS